MEVARELDAVNTERQSVETAILFDAERRLAELDGGRSTGYRQPLTCSPGRVGTPGVIGIVASRLVERYHRPFVLVALDGEGRGRGSGRSISPYDLHAGLAACARASDRVRRPSDGRRPRGRGRAASRRSGPRWSRTRGGTLTDRGPREGGACRRRRARRRARASTWRRSSSACGRSGWATPA